MNPHRLLNFKRFLLGTTFGVLPLLTSPAAWSQLATRQLLHDHVPEAVRRFHLQPAGRLPATNQLSLLIGLPLRNRAALDELLKQIYDPVSPHFRHYVSSEDFAAQFGPAESDYAAVTAFARSAGLTVTGTMPDRTMLEVSGTVAQIERTFHVTMRLYPHPRENRNFFAPDVEPSMDLAVPISHISGLDNFVVPHPAGLKAKPLNRAIKVRPNSGSSPGGLLMGNDFRAAYVPGVSLTGSNQIVGLFELDGYFPGDITSYETIAGLPNVPLTNELFSTSGAAGGNNSEVALDIEQAISMAPGLSRVIIYEGPSPTTVTTIANMLQAMYNDNLAKQISSSWDIGDNANFETMYVKLASHGQSYFQSSGDDGAYYPGIPGSADSSNVTIVGGTTLSTLGPGGPYSAEVVWNEYSNGEGAGGSGGGVSLTSIPIPSWQAGVATTTNLGSSTLRNVPDVAMNADNVFAVADNGQQETLVGTSAAAPLWAGFTALVNQYAVANGKPTVGFVNPAIYAIGKSPFYLAAFNDITNGNNTNTTVPNKYPAVPGYDLCTGWGSPAGQNFLTALATPDTLGILPGTGFTANGPVGGPFNTSAEIFTLTNSGVSSLNWSVVTPSWLTASPGSGTLVSHGATMVAVGISSAGSNSIPAVYATNVVFSNVTSHIAQFRAVTLELETSLVQNGGFETGDFSFWNFVGDVTSQGFLANGVVSSNTFDDGSGTNWVHSGEFGAIFDEPGKLAFISQPLATVPGQSYLLSFWLNNLGGATPNQMVVNWITNSTGTNTLFNQVNVGAINNWTNFQYIVTAGSGISTLQFGFRNDNFYFGLDDISLTPIPAPSFRAVATTNGNIRFTWNSLAGLPYQVQFSTNLNLTAWNNLGGPVTANSFTTTASNATSSSKQRFYRIDWAH